MNIKQITTHFFALSLICTLMIRPAELISAPKAPSQPDKQSCVCEPTPASDADKRKREELEQTCKKLASRVKRRKLLAAKHYNVNHTPEGAAKMHEAYHQLSIAQNELKEAQSRLVALKESGTQQTA